MKCEICGKDRIGVVYHGVIKTGLLDGYTTKEYDVYQCETCNTIFNFAYKDEQEDFYESEEYRKRIDGQANAEIFYKKYDELSLDKLNITGTAKFRNKTVADIGCGGGSFLDFISGVADRVVAVEPSLIYQEVLKEKGYFAYQYAEYAAVDFAGKVDVVTSFDVIEHVDHPQTFVDDMYKLCATNGSVICGTPTDYPVLRKLLGRDFDKFIFQVQHPWVFSVDAMKLMFEKAGFKNVKVKTIQKYGLGNLIAWLKEGKPKGNITYDFISDAMNVSYMSEMGRCNPEYIVVYAEK